MQMVPEALGVERREIHIGKRLVLGYRRGLDLFVPETDGVPPDAVLESGGGKLGPATDLGAEFLLRRRAIRPGASKGTSWMKGKPLTYASRMSFNNAPHGSSVSPESGAEAFGIDLP